MVFYRGRAPSGRKTEWKMNEYKAIEGEASASTSATPPPACSTNWRFLQVLWLSPEEVDEKMSKLEVKFLSLPVEEELKRYSAQTLSPSAFSRCAVQNQSILRASGSPFCEFEAYTVDSLMVVDFNGGFSNKGFKSAPIGFYPKDEHTVFQKTKHIKYSKGGRAENIRPSHIRRLRRRRNRDDEEDGEDNWRPSDSNFLSLILRIVLLLMVLLIVLSLIVWLMS
ncbi:hypothetical protein Pint_21993 [Pistacia integerrima]|uniref:Uncharacterized protein n=1 Tax=Pistacia integerrima TaxID=434235 RepID=A0ACC0YL02_9ROSI|nr:hypothetical protein Pint_21993 [Pistacia integerrima]